jgi:uncharacterized damage-inducible protein DinB
VIHVDSGWTIKDLLAHMTMWEIHYTLGLEAFNAGGDPYLIPNYSYEQIDDYNQRQYAVYQPEVMDDVLEKWAAAREAFIAAVEAVPDERMNDRLVAPANPTQNPRAVSLIKFALGHEKWHQDEIVAVVGD